MIGRITGGETFWLSRGANGSAFVQSLGHNMQGVHVQGVSYMYI